MVLQVRGIGFATYNGQLRTSGTNAFGVLVQSVGGGGGNAGGNIVRVLVSWRSRGGCQREPWGLWIEPEPHPDHGRNRIYTGR